MKRLLIGGLAVGALLFGATGVASASTTNPALAKPTKVSLAKTVPTSSVNVGQSWPLATDPGKMVLSFASHNAEAVSGMAVVCKPPTKDSPLLAIPAVLPATLATPLPNMVATFNVDPATGLSTDPDFANDGTTTTLTVGPYSVFNSTTLPPLACTVTLTNAAGLSPAGTANTATGPAPTGTCSVDPASAATGLEVQLGSGSLLPVTGVNNHAPSGAQLSTPATSLGTQKDVHYGFVLADLSAFAQSSAVPFCTTNSVYQPHLDSDVPISFATTVSLSAAVVAPAPIASQHAARVKIAGLGITSPVHSASVLSIAAGSATVYAFDSFHFKVQSCPSTATVTCASGPLAQAAIIAGSGGALSAIPNMEYIAVFDSAPHTVAALGSIVGAKISPVFERTANFATATPPALGIIFAGSSLSLSVGASPPVPVKVAPPGPVIAGINASFIDAGTALPAVCNAVTGLPGPGATCIPYSAISGHLNPYFGGDTNYSTPVAIAYSALF
jgi:hypothetical protein